MGPGPTPEESVAVFFPEELICVLENAKDLLKKREELKVKRNLLFARFLKNPLDIHLALRIKVIDDYVAECLEQMERMRKGGK